MSTDNENARTQPTYPEGNWKRIFSYASGEYLKMEDEVNESVPIPSNTVKKEYKN